MTQKLKLMVLSYVIIISIIFSPNVTGHAISSPHNKEPTIINHSDATIPDSKTNILPTKTNNATTRKNSNYNHERQYSANKQTTTEILTQSQTRPLKNYQMFEAKFRWYDINPLLIKSSPFIGITKESHDLQLSGDDVYTTVKLPFTFPFYDQYFTVVNVSSNGWLSFNTTNPTRFWSSDFPSSERDFQYVIAPFLDDLRAEDNIYYITTQNYVIFYYEKIYHLNGAPVGTFQVVLHANGTIEFNYLHIKAVDSTMIGLNYGDGFHYNIYPDEKLENIRNFSLVFYYDTFPHDLGVSIDLPDFKTIRLNETYNVVAKVQNSGQMDETTASIQFSLYLDGTQVATTATNDLAVSQTLNLNYLWTPTTFRTYNFTGIVTMANSDNNLRNNVVTKLFSVENPNQSYIEIYVQDSTTHIPINGAQITLYNDATNTIVAIGSTDSNGFYNFTNLHFGKYYLSINKSGYYPYTQPWSFYLNFIGSHTDFYANLVSLNSNQQLAYLQGYVYNSSDNIPLASAEIRLYDQLTNQLIQKTYSDINGFYNLTNIPIGRYYLHANLTTRMLGYRTFYSIYSYGEYNFDIYLFSGVISGYVFNATTNSIVNSSVNIYIVDSVNSNIISIITPDASGYYNITLPAGIYDIFANTTDSYSPIYRVGISNDQTYTRDLYLSPITIPLNSSYVEVNVHDSATSSPISSVRINVYQRVLNPSRYCYCYSEILVQTGLTDTNGFYNVTGLYAGFEYTIEVLTPQNYYDRQYNRHFYYFDRIGAFNMLYIDYIPTTIVENSNAIYGNVYNYGNGTPIQNANVSLFERHTNTLILEVTTDSNGAFTITNLSRGDYYLLVSADTYFSPEIRDVSFGYVNESVYFSIELVSLSEGWRLGYIDGYIFDYTNNTPLANAEILFYREIGNQYQLIQVAQTDVNGYYNVSLPSGSYAIITNISNYYPTYDSRSIWVGGHSTADFFVRPLTTDSQYLTTFYGFVYDEGTQDPIANASITVYLRPSSFSDLDVIVLTTYTNASGYYSFSLPGGNYRIVFTAEMYSTYVFWWYASGAGDTRQTSVWLRPPPSFQINDPLNGTLVNGAMVYMRLYFPIWFYWYTLDYIDVFVNGTYVTTIDNPKEFGFYVPIFQNGTNEISLHAWWLDGKSFNTTVVVNATNVIPLLQPQIGDVLTWSITNHQGLDYVFNFTFDYWVTQYEINVSLAYAKYKNGTPIETNQYWLVVNILNGYIPKSNMWWKYQHFYFITGYASSKDVWSIPLWKWSSIIDFRSDVDTTWNGFPTKLFRRDMPSGEYAQAEILDSGLLVTFVYSISNVNLTGEIVYTSLKLDSINPKISQPPDISYVVGSTEQYIYWTLSDDNPSYFTIYRNNTLIKNSSWWFSGMTVAVNIDGLSVGIYNFTIIAYDAFDNKASDTVIVTVLAASETAPTSTSTPTSITSGGSQPPRTVIQISTPGNTVLTSLLALIGIVSIVLIRRRRAKNL